MGEIIHTELGDGMVQVSPQELNQEYRVVKSLPLYNTNGYEFRYTSVPDEVLTGSSLSDVVEQILRDFKWLEPSRKGVIAKYPTTVKLRMWKELRQYIQPIPKINNP